MIINTLLLAGIGKKLYLCAQNSVTNGCKENTWISEGGDGE